MTTKSSQGIMLFVISLILFGAGTGLCILNHFDKSQDFLSRENLLALCMGAFLTTAEISFLWADYRLINAKRTIKKIGCAMVLVALICTMTWAIGSEWESAESKDRGKLGLSAIGTISSGVAGAAKSRRERSAIADKSIGAAKEITSELLGSSTRAYQANFFIALIGFVICHFCVERQKKRSCGRGNILDSIPGLRAWITERMPEASGRRVAAYDVDGGVAVHLDGRYARFVSRADIDGLLYPPPPPAASQGRRIGF